MGNLCVILYLPEICRNQFDFSLFQDRKLRYHFSSFSALEPVGTAKKTMVLFKFGGITLKCYFLFENKPDAVSNILFSYLLGESER